MTVGLTAPAICAQAQGPVKQERHPATGYWVSYDRSAGDNPLVAVIIQRLD